VNGPALTLGTAGHIDHGKTVLVRALTGVDTDRLPEERARGISIALGFARLELPSGRALSVVDVPGHDRFVRTMVAGATGIDLFLLVVAADDGVMQQTREHLAILEVLQVPTGVVAVTKIDAVDEDQAALVAEEARDLLARGPYAGAEVVPVSAPRREGLDRLIGALGRAAGVAPGRAAGAEALRLHVDRSFTLTGMGTVVTGTLWAGELHAGGRVRIEPSGLEARVRGLEVHGHAVESAAPGQRVAVNLAGLDRREVERGDVLTEPGAPLRPAWLVDAAIELRPGSRPLRRGARVHLHHGTRESPARVAPLEGDSVEPGHRALVQLRLERAIVPAPGDRFVLRQVAPPDTVGGGVVIDAAPRKHGPGARHLARLRSLEAGDPLGRLALALEESPGGLGVGDAEPELLERLAAEGRAEKAGLREVRYFSPGGTEAARRRLTAALADLASAKSPRPASRRALASAAGLPEPSAQALLEEMVAANEVREKAGGFLMGAGDVADPMAAALLELLAADGLEPRGVPALAAATGALPAAAAEALERLALDDAVVRVKPGLYYHPDSLERARALVTGICERDGSVTIARLRDEIGTSRKYSQALLERLDAERLLLRIGDEHVLRRRRP
jgi:selenocysteine-specific elongation factor